MRVNSILAGAFLLGTVTVVSSAFAANSDIRIQTPAAVNIEASVSRDCKDLFGNTIPKCTAFNSFAGVVVTATNDTTNTVNQVNFDALVKVVGGGRAQLAYSIPDICRASDGDASNETKVHCDVGQLRGSTDVVLILKVPTIGTQLDFKITGGTFSSGGSPDSTPANFAVDEFDTAFITLITTEIAQKQANFKTVVPPVGGTFFTGFGVPTDIDTFVTKLNVPSPGTAGYFIASAYEKTPVEEPCPTSAPCGGSVDVSLKKKDTSKATFYPTNPVDALKEFLVIELWRSDFKGNIKNANIYYKDPDAINPTYVAIFECAPYPSQTVPRCIFDRKVFTSKDQEVKDGKVPAGSARIRILAGENGFYSW